jgi:cell division protein FtsQ
LQQVGAIAGNGPATAGRPAAPSPNTVRTKSTTRKSATTRVHTRRRPARKSRIGLWLTALVVLTITGASAVILAPQLLPVTASADGPSRFDKILTAAGFGIDEVAVSGHRYTADSDIFDALDLPNVATMAALQTAQVQARLRRLPWIATANLTRVYPGRIDVAVTERTPFAAWTKGSSIILVDATGRELSPVRETDWSALPRIAGEGAPEQAASLFQMLAHFPEIANRIEHAVRITQRRWQLHLTNGVRIELPPEGEATTVASLLANRTSARYLDQSNTIIDLRSPTRIAARPAVAVATAAPVAPLKTGAR